MSVQFNVVERGKPGSPETPKKFYPSIVATGKVSQRDVAKRAAEMSTVSAADTAAVVENFLTIIAQELAKGNIATQGNDSKVTDFVSDERVLALARRIHEVAPSSPTKGCDIIREEGTGRLFVLEFNPGGNTWHFSSRMSARPRANRPPEHEQRRHAQFDAFRTAARVLVERTNAEAV